MLAKLGAYAASKTPTPSTRLFHQTAWVNRDAPRRCGHHRSIFPIASPDDFDAVNQIARVVGNEVDEDGYVPVICGLSRANPKDIERAWEAVKPAVRPRVHTFIATSARSTWRRSSRRRRTRFYK